MASLDDTRATRFSREIRRFLNNNNLVFTDFVPNFRQARRFANAFALNLNSVIKHTKDITISDFFGIELIHFTYPDVYQTLMHQPMALLKNAPKVLSKADIFVYDGGDDKPCDKLLKVLFRAGNVTVKTTKEIRSKISYANYFCYRLPRNSLGATEFELSMTSDGLDEVRNSVHSWLERGITSDSIFAHFKGYNMHDYKDIKVIRNYVCALIEFLPHLTSNGIHQIISERYWIRSEVNETELRKQIAQLFEYAIDKGQSLNEINFFLASLITAYPEDFEPDEIEEPLLDYCQCKELSEKTLAKYIELNGKPAPCVITQKDSAFHNFLMSARYISEIERVGDIGVNRYSNYMVDELIRQYKGIKADLNSFREFVNPYIIKTSDPNIEIYEAKDIRVAVQSLFVSIENLEKFVKETFLPEPEIEEELKKVRGAIDYAENEM